MTTEPFWDSALPEPRLVLRDAVDLLTTTHGARIDEVSLAVKTVIDVVELEALARLMRTIANSYTDRRHNDPQTTSYRFDRTEAIYQIMDRVAVETPRIKHTTHAEVLYRLILRGPVEVATLAWSVAFAVPGTVARRPDPEKEAMAQLTQTIDYIRANEDQIEAALYPREQERHAEQ